MQSNSFVTQTLPINQYEIMHIGSGPMVRICRKDNGAVKKEIKFAGSHLNAFEKIEDEKASFYIFGGE